MVFDQIGTHVELVPLLSLVIRGERYGEQAAQLCRYWDARVCKCAERVLEATGNRPQERPLFARKRKVEALSATNEDRRSRYHCCSSVAQSPCLWRRATSSSALWRVPDATTALPRW